MTGSPLPKTPPRVIPGPVSLALLPLQPPSFAGSSSALQCQRPGTWLGDFLALPPSLPLLSGLTLDTSAP